MKILICSNGYNTLKGQNSIGIFQLDQAGALLKNGYDVRIASIDLRSLRRKRNYGTYSFKINGIKAATSNFPFGSLPFGGIKERIAVFCANKAYSEITKDGWKPDIIHAHFCDVAAAFSHIAQRNAIPYVTTEHYSKMHLSTVRKTVLREAVTAYKASKEVIAVSNSLAESIFEKTGFHAVMIPNIVDMEIFGVSDTQKKAAPFTFLSAGHLKRVKGMDILLQAFCRCKDNDAKLIIMGDGDEKENLISLANELGLHERVRFTGEYTRQEFQQNLEFANCFVLASRSETFGVVYVEAMAAGVPVIGTKCGGPNEIITPDVGMIVSPEDIDELASAMDQMIDKWQMYEPNQISNYARNKYGEQEIVDQLTKIYKRVAFIHE